jgi:hypothetical protein
MLHILFLMFQNFPLNDSHPTVGYLLHCSRSDERTDGLSLVGFRS